MTRRWAPQTRYTLRRNTASIMKGLVFGLENYRNDMTCHKDMFCKTA